jgi:outer membrane protein insertion porin family
VTIRYIKADFKQDFAGLGGDSRFIKTTTDVKYYREITDNFVGLLHGQAGYVYGPDLRIIDNFFMGPDLVRGFALSGMGPRDSSYDTSNNALGGTSYIGASSEVQFPLFGLPREAGLKGAFFADAGTIFGFTGSTSNVKLVGDDAAIRTSLGTGLIWASPIGPIRLDFAWPITKNDYDQTQIFRFVAGTTF